MSTRIDKERSLAVVLATRKRGEFSSIEEVFDTIAGSIPCDILIRIESAPETGASLGALLRNLFWTNRIKQCDLFHITGDIHYAALRIGKQPIILTIHDLRFIDEALGIRRFLFRLLWVAIPVRRAAHVTVISEFTKERLLSLCRIKAEHISVIPNCVGLEFTPTHKPWPLGNPRVLHVGTTKNKNLERLASAFEGIQMRMVILGRLGLDQRVLLEERRINYQEVFGLNRAEVVELYQGCDVVVFASTYEGFGMPIVEGQAVGRPVITSNISPMREVAGGAAVLVDPFDVHSIREGISKVLADATLRHELVQKGFENARKYSPDSVAAQYAELYRQVVARR